jgi:hypothetical protein
MDSTGHLRKELMHTFASENKRFAGEWPHCEKSCKIPFIFPTKSERAFCLTDQVAIETGTQAGEHTTVRIHPPSRTFNSTRPISPERTIIAIAKRRLLLFVLAARHHSYSSRARAGGNHQMKPMPRVLVIIALAVSLIGVAAFARELGAREAREKIALALGLDKPDNVHIKNIGRGPGGDAIVEAQFDAAFRFTADKTGKWQAVEVRTGDRRWESIELIHTAIRKEKALRTAADLRTLATALEAYRRDNGSYVVADICSVLIDHLAPKYLSSIIRLDAWSHEFDYKGAIASYRLASLGPDGKSGTDDDIVLENGQLVKGAVE